MKNLLLLVLLMSTNVFAGGSGPAPTTWEEFFPTLFWPAFNVILLIVLLVWKLKTPVSSFFHTKSETIAEIMERASVKAKEAEMMMQMQRKKIEGMEVEIEKIHSDVETEMKNFEASYAKEVDERIEKLKTDAALKIEAEKKQLTEQLNSILLEEVISKTKQTIKSNKQLSEQATSRALEGLR
jgi:F0F1-type ATP synthase membrane subunit b/b'